MAVQSNQELSSATRLALYRPLKRAVRAAEEEPPGYRGRFLDLPHPEKDNAVSTVRVFHQLTLLGAPGSALGGGGIWPGCWQEEYGWLMATENYSIYWHYQRHNHQSNNRASDTPLLLMDELEGTTNFKRWMAAPVEVFSTYPNVTKRLKALSELKRHKPTPSNRIERWKEVKRND